MKVPFDADYIQEASELGINIDAITREGHRVRIVEFDGELYGDGGDFPLLGYDLDAKDPSTVRSWKKDGTYFREDIKHPRDLLYMDIYMIMPFDFELAQLALFAETGKIVTKGGKEVKITCWNNPVNFNYPIVGQIAGEEVFRTWTKEGNYYDGRVDYNDLFIEEL